MTNPKDLEDLDKKVEFLKGILGYTQEKDYFRDKAIASALKMSSEYWSRKKKGAKSGGVAIDEIELGRLLVYFGLAPQLDWRVFTLDFDKFVAKMRDGGVGAFGAGDGARALQRLLNDPNCRDHASCIRIANVGGVRAGLGAKSDSAGGGRLMLPVGARAKMSVSTPGQGHLIILNQHVSFGETTCLMPSLFRPSQDVSGGIVHLPADGAAQTAFEVQGPPGFYRVFAVWARAPLGPPWARKADGAPRVLDGRELTLLVDDLQGRPQNGKTYVIHTAEYRVIG